MTNDSSPSCSRCGTPVASDAPGDLCPRCLLALSLETNTLGESEVTPLPTPKVEDLQVHFPQLDIIECLGRGGMGVVYKARQKSLNREVALKLLAPERAHDPDFESRFKKEAQALASLNHPNIVTIYDFGEAGDFYYLLMEFIDGVNLRQAMSAGRFSPEQALAIVPPICEALQFAHDHGIVHRDIKPENLLLDQENRVKIADFGIAHILEGDAQEVLLTGTPSYMAPEQTTDPVQADHRVDIYALGVVLYEMLTGERPKDDLVPPSSYSRADARVDGVVLRALESDPEKRYQTAEEFRTQVTTVTESTSSTPEPPSLPPIKPKGMFKRWWPVFLVMILLSPVVGIGTSLLAKYVLPKKYEATAVVQCHPAAMQLDPEALTPGHVLTQNFIANKMETITAKETLQIAIKDLDLTARWSMQEHEVLLVLENITTVNPVRGSDFMNINVRHANATDARDIANAIAMAGYKRALSHVETSRSPTITIHEEAKIPETPVFPNFKLFLLIGTAGALLLSPFLALLFMWILHRIFPEKKSINP